MGRRGTGFAVGVLLVLVMGAAPPSAGAAVDQPGEPTIVVEQAQPLLAAYDYTVRVVGADGAPINSAAVTGTPVGPDGAIGRITTLNPADQDGRYRGIVEMPGPGTWTVRFAVADPVANLEHVQEMTPPGGPPAADAPVVTEPPVAEEAPPPADDDASRTEPAAGPAEDDGGSNAIPTLLAVAAAVLILAFGGVAILIIRRRREAEAALAAVQQEDPLHALVVDDADDHAEDDAELAQRSGGG